MKIAHFGSDIGIVEAKIRYPQNIKHIKRSIQFDFGLFKGGLNKVVEKLPHQRDRCLPTQNYVKGNCKA